MWFLPADGYSCVTWRGLLPESETGVAMAG